MNEVRPAHPIVKVFAVLWCVFMALWLLAGTGAGTWQYAPVLILPVLYWVVARLNGNRNAVWKTLEACLLFIMFVILAIALLLTTLTYLPLPA